MNVWKHCHAEVAFPSASVVASNSSILRETFENFGAWRLQSGPVLSFLTWKHCRGPTDAVEGDQQNFDGCATQFEQFKQTKGPICIYSI